MPFAWEMGAKTWQHPEAHKRWVEEEKAKAAAAKKKKEEEKLAKEVEKEQRKLMRKELVDQTREHREHKEDEYLAQLKADVARLEQKRTGDAPEKRFALYDQVRAAKQAEERENEVAKEVKLSALEMLALRERELEKKKTEQEQELAELADRRRRELLEYKHALGLSSTGTHPPQRPKRFPSRPLSLLDDPEFWRLPDADRNMLELMSPEERVQYGFGPYDEDEVEYEPELRQRFASLGVTPAASEEQLAQRIRRFVFTREPHPPGVTAVYEPITLSIPLEGIPDLSTLSAEDQRSAQLIIKDESKRLRDELAKFAIEEFGANALVDFQEGGIVPTAEQELLDAGCIYELRAQGVPARLSQAPPAPPARKAHFASHGAPKYASADPWASFGRGHGGLTPGNGGAGWEDAPLFGAGERDAPGHLSGGWGGPASVGAGTGWDGWAGGAGGAAPGWSKAAVPGGWGGEGWGGAAGRGGGGRPDGGAIWRGFPKRPPAGGGPWDRPAPHEQAPPELRNLPWGAQQYVKKVREQREREERELANAAAAGAPVANFPQHTVHPFLHPPHPVEDPALFGNAFPRPAYAASPGPPPGLAYPTAATARAETQRAMVDPDDGGGAGAAGAAGWGVPAVPAAMPAPVPTATQGWSAEKGGPGQLAGAAWLADVWHAAAPAGRWQDLRAGQAW